MKFKKDTDEGKQYLNNLYTYIQELNKFVATSEKILQEHPDVKDNDQIVSMNSIFLALKKHSENALDIYNKANSGASVFSADFDALAKGKNEIEERVNKLLMFINDVSTEAKDSYSIAYGKEIKLLQSFADQSDKLYAPVKNHPDLELEPAEMPQAKQEEKNVVKVEPDKEPIITTERKSVSTGMSPRERLFAQNNRNRETVVNPYMKEYIAEFKRLSQELAKTDPWYSKGSPSYQALRNSLDGFNSRLANADSSYFDVEFRNVINEFNQLADGYRLAHSDMKLDKRQMNRLKIMNRFYMLGERFKNPATDPTKDYESKIAEKCVHARAIDNLTNNPDNKDAKTMLMRPDLLAKNVKRIVSNPEFIDVLPKKEDMLKGMVTTKGQAIYKSLELSVEIEQDTLEILEQAKEENRKLFEEQQKIIQKSKEEAKIKEEPKTQNDKPQDKFTDEEMAEIQKQIDAMENKEQQKEIDDIEKKFKQIDEQENPDKLSDKQIADYEKQFMEMEKKGNSDKLSDKDIADYEKQFAEMEKKPSTNIQNTERFVPDVDLSSTLSPKEKRAERMAGHPDKGVGTADEFLNDPEMEQLEAQMLAGSEFNYSGAIPDKIRLSSSINELAKFKNDHPELSEADKKYIDSHIATEKFYKKLEERRITAEPIGPVTRQDGSVVLEHIHLDTLQTSNMGCYSCSEMLLLQSRGLNLDQRQIRNYRMEDNATFASLEEKSRVKGDQMGNIIDVGGIASRCLKNTAMHERTYSQISTAGPETKKKVAADIRKTIQDALLIHKSPVSLLRGYHYVTIVGFNAQTDTVIYKNSLMDSDHKPGDPIIPDDEHTMTINELINTQKLSVAHLMTINPENPTEFMTESKNVEYINGQYMENNPALTGVKKDYNNPDGKLIWNYKMLGDGGRDICSIQSVTKVPKALELTPEMKQRIGNKFKVMPLKDSPEKQELMKTITAAENKLFNKNDELLITGNLDMGNTKWADLSFKCNGKTVPNEKVMDYLYLQKLKANIDTLTPWQVKNAFGQERFKAAEEGMANNDGFNALHAHKGNPVKISEFSETFINFNTPAQQQKVENKELGQQEKNEFSLFK